jgi:hypothetical protein
MPRILCLLHHVWPITATLLTFVVDAGRFLRWHRQGFRLFWRWKSRPGRPPIPVDLQALIRQMARDNPM